MKNLFTEINLVLERFHENNKECINIYIKNNYLYSLL